VLELITSLWLHLTGQTQPLQLRDPQGIGHLISQPWGNLLDARDPEAEAIVQRYLQTLSGQGLSPAAQGVWLQSGMVLLANHQGQTPLPAASLTKTATTLAALETWGPAHQFDTLISTTGTVQSGVLNGDLIIQGGGDPMFVWEEAIAVGAALNRLGIKQVTGDLVITGSFLMNFEFDPLKSGVLLKQALDSRQWDAEAQAQFAKLPPGTAAPVVAIAGSVRTAEPVTAKLLIKRRSLPLAFLLKRMNIYSNNVMSEQLSRLLGGAAITAQKAAAAAGVSPQEIRLANGSGLGPENQISPHAVTAIMAAIERYAMTQNLTLADLFPVSGTDIGTIEDRQIPRLSVVKTGTLSDVSALSGVMPTRDRGLVWFTILNRGTNLDALRAQQDVLLQQLQRQWGTMATRPAEITPRLATNDPRNQLGAMERSEVPIGG
jgi:serine-type D-Ala-D-Ala carboxypeptidase/endopeptidase (penicillin-binding protein 4)